MGRGKAKIQAGVGWVEEVRYGEIVCGETEALLHCPLQVPDCRYGAACTRRRRRRAEGSETGRGRGLLLVSAFSGTAFSSIRRNQQSLPSPQRKPHGSFQERHKRQALSMVCRDLLRIAEEPLWHPAACSPCTAQDVCFAFVAGKCAFGRQCHDKHPDEASCQSIKERYGKIDCQWGRGCRTDGCLYRHPSDEPVGPALRLEMKPQPAVVWPLLRSVAFHLLAALAEAAIDDTDDRNDLPVFRHLDDREANSRDRDRSVPQRDRLQEWLEEQDAPRPEELKASQIAGVPKAVPLRAPLDEEEEEGA
ncbi:unnamed protein product [Symbiodinium sp. CCMP2592]|nr:unnamed protein product [Symbiodinium sp. CCMP2592]